MCNAPVIQTVVRGATDIMTFGTAEIGGVSKKIGGAAAGIGEAAGVVKPPANPQAQSAAADQSAAQTEEKKIGPPQVGQTVLDQGATAKALAKKRQAALAAGMLSTFGPNGQPPAPPSLVSAPQAFASGMKTALGQ